MYIEQKQYKLYLYNLLPPLYQHSTLKYKTDVNNIHFVTRLLFVGCMTSLNPTFRQFCKVSFVIPPKNRHVC